VTIARYRARRWDSAFPLTFNRPYRVVGIPIGRGPRAGSVRWVRHPRPALLRNEPEPRLIGELLLQGVTSGV
jgi:hypothetical protein